MQVIELSEFRDEQGEITFENRARGTAKFGFSWYGDMQAQETVTKRLQGVLDDDHMLLRNVPLVGTEVLAPMILFSPQGVRLLYPSTVKGTFRAQGDTWQSFGGRSRKFTPATPNMQFRALSFARGLHRYFESQGFPLPDLEAVLIFVNTQTHVDSANPEARIVLADGIDHFASNMLELQHVMDQEDMHLLVDSLVNPKLPEPEVDEAEAVAGEGQEVFDTEALRPRQERSDLTPERRYGVFTTRQWVILGVLGGFQLILILAIAAVILGDALF